MNIARVIKGKNLEFKELFDSCSIRVSGYLLHCYSKENKPLMHHWINNVYRNL